MKTVHRLSGRILKWFFQGLLFLAPLVLSIYAVYFVFTRLDAYFHFAFPGMGILIIFLLITLFGALASSFVARPILRYLEAVVTRAPLVKILYAAIKDILSAFVGDEKKFSKPVLVRLDGDANLERLGFMTEENLSKLGLTDDKAAVYVPHSYNFSGNLYIVPKENIVPLNVPPADLLKFIVSAGVVRVPGSELPTSDK
jgi:uncharacterized membrane protein